MLYFISVLRYGKNDITKKIRIAFCCIDDYRHTYLSKVVLDITMGWRAVVEGGYCNFYRICISVSVHRALQGESADSLTFTPPLLRMLLTYIKAKQNVGVCCIKSIRFTVHLGCAVIMKESY